MVINTLSNPITESMSRYQVGKLGFFPYLLLIFIYTVFENHSKKSHFVNLPAKRALIRAWISGEKNLKVRYNILNFPALFSALAVEQKRHGGQNGRPTRA